MELSGRELKIMESIKKVFDPKKILNPGKIFS
jgi:FAD/FMN-containing dehydrogenase